MKKNDFKLLEADWEYGKKTFMYFIVKKEKLSDTVELNGPPANAKVDAKRFRAKHKKVLEKNKRLFAVEKRAYKEPLKLVKDLLKEKHIKEKAGEIKCSKI